MDAESNNVPQLLVSDAFGVYREIKRSTVMEVADLVFVLLRSRTTKKVEINK